MIKLAIPFLLSNPEQIPDIAKGTDVFFEGNVFDADLFVDSVFWEKIENIIITLNKEFPNQLYSLHFPVENADYLISSIVRENFYRFIDLASKFNVRILVLHSNNVELFNTFKVDSLEKKRKQYLSFFKDLDARLISKDLVVCVENMPIIGNNGDDVDSIFVFPKDFENFKFKKVKIVWDIGHWANTWCILQSLGYLSPYIRINNVPFHAFLSLRNELAHFQFSSFKTIALPGTRSKCLEGVTPTKGDIDESLLMDVLRTIHSWKETFTMTLEIQDKDYTNRVNLLETITWMRDKILNQ